LAKQDILEKKLVWFVGYVDSTRYSGNYYFPWLAKQDILEKKLVWFVGYVDSTRYSGNYYFPWLAKQVYIW